MSDYIGSILIVSIGANENGEKPMTNIGKMFLHMCLVSPPEVDVCSEENNANPETQTIN
jgi:hypothetical protein